MPQNLLEHVSASYLLLRQLVTSHLGGRRRISSTRGLTFGRSLSLTAWRLTGSAIWRRGSVTTYWGSASRGTWRKTARKSLVGVFLLQCQRRRSSVGGFECFSRQ
ncbi:hypothetical protein TNCV_4716571 [Trichonephila clavipes]|nr:hypothetical protein TNCV_4716571 [Trichonephila clavipes]